MDSNKSPWQSLIDAYHTAENFLADMPIAKAIGGVIANPTPQEVGAQVAGLGKTITNEISEETKDPISLVLNYGPSNIGGIIKIINEPFRNPYYKLNKVEFKPGGVYDSLYTSSIRGDGIRVSGHENPKYAGQYKKIGENGKIRIENGEIIDFISNKKTPAGKLEDFENILKNNWKDIFPDKDAEDWFMDANGIKAEDLLDK